MITFLKKCKYFQDFVSVFKTWMEEKGDYLDVILIIPVQKIPPPFISLHLAFLKMSFQLGCLEEMLIEGRGVVEQFTGSATNSDLLIYLENEKWKGVLVDKHLEFSEFVLRLKMEVRKSENHNKEKIPKAQACLRRIIWYNK